MIDSHNDYGQNVRTTPEDREEGEHDFCDVRRMYPTSPADAKHYFRCITHGVDFE